MNRRHFIFSTAALASLSLSACSEERMNEVAVSKPVNLDGLWAQARGFQTGAPTARARAVIFFDAQCPHCGVLWRAIEPLHEQTNLLWVPCGLLNRASISQGAALLEAENPVQAMQDHERLLSSGRGGMAASASPRNEVLAHIRANTELLSLIGGTSVPLTVWEASGLLQTRAGSMSSSEFAALLGLPG